MLGSRLVTQNLNVSRVEAVHHGGTVASQMFMWQSALYAAAFVLMFIIRSPIHFLHFSVNQTAFAEQAFMRVGAQNWASEERVGIAVGGGAAASKPPGSRGEPRRLELAMGDHIDPKQPSFVMVNCQLFNWLNEWWLNVHLPIRQH